MRVTITGAAGDIGRALMAGLSDVGHDVRGIDRVAAAAVDTSTADTSTADTSTAGTSTAGTSTAGTSTAGTSTPGAWSERITVADIGTDDEALATVISGADAVVHLAAVPHETDFETAIDTHLRLTHRVLERCRTAGVPRFVYASSNHAVGFTPRTDLVTADVRPRPDMYYGVGKAAAEALCSLFHDRYGIEVACLRIGSFLERPRNRRGLSTWLSPGDAVRLVDACLTAPKLGFAVLYGISANSRAWWDLAPARALGYEPQDDAERWAAEILATPETDEDRLDAQHVGGEFTRLPLGARVVGGRR